MKARWFTLVGLFILLAIIAGACAPPASTPIPSPTASQAPPAKVAAAATPAATTPAAATPAAATPAAAKPTAAAPTAAPRQVKLKVGESVPKAALLGLPLRVGQDRGIFQKRGLDVEIVSFQGDAPAQAALASGSIDILVASGPGTVASIAKGIPAKIVAVEVKTVTTFAILVPINSPIKSASDLRGKKVAITSFGALTDWIVRRIAALQGWDPEKGIERVAMGGAYMPMVTAMNSGQVDAMAWTFYTGYELEEKGLGKIAFQVDAAIAPAVEQQDVAASQKLLKENPEVVKAFLESLFEAIKYMKGNKVYAIDMMANPDVVGISRSVAEKSYDVIMSAYSDDGALSEEAAKFTGQSLLDLGTLKELPSPAAIYDKQFVPVKVQ